MHRLVRVGRVARRFTTTAPPPPPVTTTTTAAAAPPPPLLPRILLFSAVSLSLSLGAAGYTLVTNEQTLFWARDNFPRTVNLVAPVLGLPQEHVADSSTSSARRARRTTGDNEPEPVFADELEEKFAHEFDHIAEVVGDEVFVCCKLAGGDVIILPCAANETPTELSARVLVGRAQGERVLDVAILDASRAQELLQLDPGELARRMNHVPIPEIPSVLSVNSVGVALELCRQTELDLKVRLRLSQSESDSINIQRALQEIDTRKVELKRLLKEERSKLGVQSIFRRGR